MSIIVFKYYLERSMDFLSKVSRMKEHVFLSVFQPFCIQKRTKNILEQGYQFSKEAINLEANKRNKEDEEQ